MFNLFGVHISVSLVNYREQEVEHEYEVEGKGGEQNYPSNRSIWVIMLVNDGIREVS